MKVLVTGGTGFIGRGLVHRLAMQGHECMVVSRDPARAATSGLPAGTVFLRDVGAAPSVDAVVLLAGESPAGRWTPTKRAAILASRVEGTRNAVDWMRTTSPRPPVLVSPSAVGYYGHRPGEMLDESSGPDPAGGFRSRVCLRWEAEAHAAEQYGVRTVVPRFGLVFGADGGILPELLRLHRLHLSFVLGNPDAVVPWVALDDTVSFIVRALDDSELGGVVNIVAPVRTTQRALTTALARAVGSTVLGTVPAGLIRLMLGEMSTAILDNAHVVPTAATAAGFEFAETDLAAYLRRILKG
jgi:uncharacterized protein